MVARRNQTHAVQRCSRFDSDVRLRGDVSAQCHRGIVRARVAGVPTVAVGTYKLRPVTSLRMTTQL